VSSVDPEQPRDLDDPADAADLPTRFGRYEVLGPLARGGMAEVFLARATGLGGFERRFVIKRLQRDLAGDEGVVRMFLDEARLCAALQHPNIVQVVDVDRGPSGVFMVMEFLHGVDLMAVLRRTSRAGIPIPMGLALHVVLAVCAGLHHAHEHRDDQGRPLGLVHRDISPHNVFATYDGAVKVIDFGIAKAHGRLAGTRTGTIKGKLGYMAPEQCRGLPLDRRCDVFCAGILLFELTTGRKLYRGRDDYELLRAVVERRATRPSTVVPGYPAALEAVVMRALAMDPDDRYPTAAALAADVEAFRRQHDLLDGTAELAAYLRDLFGPELRAWEGARSDPARQLDTLRRPSSEDVGAPSEEDVDPPDVPAAAHVETTRSTVTLTAMASPGSAQAEPLTTVAQPARPRRASKLGLAVVAVAALGLGAWRVAVRSAGSRPSAAPIAATGDAGDAGVTAPATIPPDAAIAIADSPAPTDAAAPTAVPEDARGGRGPARAPANRPPSRGPRPDPVDAGAGPASPPARVEVDAAPPPPTPAGPPPPASPPAKRCNDIDCVM